MPARNWNRMARYSMVFEAMNMEPLWVENPPVAVVDMA